MNTIQVDQTVNLARLLRAKRTLHLNFKANTPLHVVIMGQILKPEIKKIQSDRPSACKQGGQKITDTCERHTSASALSSPLMPIYT